MAETMNDNDNISHKIDANVQLTGDDTLGGENERGRDPGSIVAGVVGGSGSGNDLVHPEFGGGNLLDPNDDGTSSRKRKAYGDGMENDDGTSSRKRKAEYIGIDGDGIDGDGMDGDGMEHEDDDVGVEDFKDDDEDDHEEDDDDDNDEGGKQEKKSKSSQSITRIRYSNDFKVKVLDELEVTNVTVAEMARRHKLPEATLRDWVKTKDKITTAQVNRRGSAKSNSRDNLQKVTDALRTFMDLNDRLGACGMSKLPITNAMIAKHGQEVKALLLEKDANKPFLTAQERKTLNVSDR